ncbi:MAG TPA: GDP-mannose 4,6-dehydratase [bacterium]
MSGSPEFRRALVTGVAGAAGSSMAEFLVREAGIEVHGTVRRRTAAALQNVAAIAGRVALHDCDLTDLSSVLAVLASARPDAIFHFASSANVPASFTAPAAVLANNILGTCNLLEAVRLTGGTPAILHASTSKVYGDSAAGRPIAEEAPLQPLSPYAVSKAAQEALAVTYGRSYGMRIVRTRTFGYLNPRREDLFSSSFARQVARIEAGLQAELLHGDLRPVRTLLDIRDAVEANWLALRQGEPGEVYNIGGDTTLSVGEFLEVLRGHSRVPIPARVDPALLRPVDTLEQVPDCAKFTSATGWRPKVPAADSVRDLLEEWRRRTRAAAT